MTDGYDGDFFEEGGKDSVEYPLMAIEEEEATLTMEGYEVTVGDEFAIVLVCKSAKPVTHDDECATAGPMAVVHTLAQTGVFVKRGCAVR